MIYADYNGSTPLTNDVRDFLISRLQTGEFGNPNATHSGAKSLMFEMEKCRRSIAKSLGCKSSQILFNSGSSEGISHIFFSLFNEGPKNNKNIIITSGIEHSAVVNACKYYASKGFELLTIKTLESGVVDINHLSELISQNQNKIALVTVMAANNETGVVQPYKEIGKLCEHHGVYYFSDTTQYIGKTEFNFKESHMDFAVLSSHKVGSVIGSGLIIAKNTELLKSHVWGGGQERCLRGGTQNYIGIEAMALALEKFNEKLESLAQLRKLRDHFEANIKKNFPKVVIIGEAAPRLASTTLIAFPGLGGHLTQAEMENQGVYVTTSSACCDSQTGPSKVLQAMNLPEEIGSSVVRISLCTNANQELYEKIELALTKTYNKLINQ